MAMTIEMVRDWAAKTPASNGWQAKERDDAVAALTAHLTQPAQAVDAGAIREVADGLAESCHLRSRVGSSLLGMYADKLTRALSAEKADGWRDIATAPKDGVFLVWLAEPMLGSSVHAAQWSPNYKTIGSVFHFDAPKPTHWMPLPTPPTDGEE